MRLIIRNRSEEVAKYICEYITKRINIFAPTAERPFVLGLPTGSSPLPIYHALITAYEQGRVSFRNVVTFNMDEYVGLERNHAESYHSFMYTNFFRHIDINTKNINILDGNAANLAEECLAYEAKIKALGGIELFLGGVGSDGHIAFNEPGSSLASRTRVKSLAYETIVANARFFNGDLNLVPRMALTVGVQTIMEAREVIIIATGTAKSLAIQQAVESGVSHMCTLSCLQLHPCSTLVVDEDATLELRVKTVKVSFSIPKTALTPDETPNNASISKEFQTGDLTPDSMSSRIGEFKFLAARSATIPLALT
ncbi:putative glucosamine-6-phosphate isomerase [Talaromyces proteolyticus]|uniref:Glucosamine-6-phosphate isomerase n=1 Tax=Talaromyces proteolyticus TaxID=1131652 RepID=A0AAD4KVH9_9EURO|nr:putative glucosamine-6-phosphate isomerase [Talaromyces proteolyticus]KAH8697641.1 putative glucosamine-6-phosphate isomerase [Talaromyces proteolyticus]